MNKVILIGNLTRDPEVSETSSGITYCRFSIAVGRRFANADGERETDFFNITAWRTQAENCGKYLKKGSKVAILGTLQNRSYEDREGNKRTATDIIAEEVEFLSKPNTRDDDEYEYQPPVQRKAENFQPSKARPALQEIDDDDVPF